MKHKLLVIFRWILSLILPVPVAMILRPLVSQSLDSVLIGQDTILGRAILAYVSGVITAIVPTYVAPNNSRIVSIIISSFYVAIGSAITIVSLRQGSQHLLGSALVISGMLSVIVFNIIETIKANK